MRSITLFKRAGFILAGLLATHSHISANLIVDDSSISKPIVIDFTQFSHPINVFTAGPVQLGNPLGLDIQWSANHELAIIGGGGSGTGLNGYWTADMLGYTDLNAETGFMTYIFNSAPVSAVGGFINYAPQCSSHPFISVLDKEGLVLEIYDLALTAPIDTPWGINEGAFRGIQRDDHDIHAFRLYNCSIMLDNLTFDSQTAPNPSIPEPSSYGLLATVCLLFSILCRKCEQLGKRESKTIL